MNAACARCGLHHLPGELFIATAIGDRPMLEDACELESAWCDAHATPQSAGSRAYHATDSLAAVLADGLDPAKANGPCKHMCLAETPEIAAATMEVRRRFNGIPLDVEFPVLEVNTEGLDLFFELGEARHHGGRIGPERLALLDPQPAPITTGWSDPAWRRQHSDCLVLAGLPLSRRGLHAARAEADRRWGYAHTFEQFRAVARELAVCDAAARAA
jgi:hypothetical protein